MENNIPIHIEEVSFQYASSPATVLNRISLKVDRGEMVMVMGHGGAGKSTLCKLLIALIPQRIPGFMEGKVLIYGANTREKTPTQLARHAGLVFQDFESQLFSTNVELEVAFGPQNLSIPPEEIRTRVHEALSSVGLLGFEFRQPATLSGGEKQRLAIASVLSLHPKLLCLDEPTSDLDPVGKSRIFNIARDYSLAKDNTLIIVDHETNEALHADRVILMKQGSIVGNGSPREILSDPEKLLSCGVMPPQIAHAFQKFGCSPETLPFEIDQGFELFRQKKFFFDENYLSSLLRAQEDTLSKYGDVVIRARGLGYDYSGHHAIQDISLDIRQGEFLAIVGQNGSGKTTLVKHFNGLLKPTYGSIEVYGQSVTHTGVVELSKKVGYVFQNPDHQIFNDTVFDEVAFTLRLRKIPEDEIRQRVDDVLKVVGLSGRDDEDPFSLTKGERQRLAVASVLAYRPVVIIMDEPTTGLDYIEQRRMMDLLKQLNENGHTIIIITHSMWVVSEYAHRMIVMAGGKIVANGSVRSVFGESESNLVAAGLLPPPIVRLSNKLEHTLLSVSEFVSAIRGN